MNRPPPSDAPDDVTLSVRLERVERRLADVEAVLHRLEVLPSPLPPESVKSPEPEARSGAVERMAEAIPLFGRALLVLGGAFLLRAITESGWVRPTVGAALGIVYALFWFAMADRSARRGNRSSATAHGITATAIAFPLLWETAVPFGYLGPLAATVALGAISGVGLAVAWRRRLFGLVWVVTFASVLASLVLAQGTRALAPFFSYALLLGAVTYWLGAWRGRPGPAIAVAIPNDLFVLLVGALVLLGDPERVATLIDPRAALALQLGLVVIWVGSFIARALITRHEVGAFEVAQGAAATVVGLGGADALTRAGGGGQLALGTASLVLAVVGYGASFWAIDRAGGKRANFMLFTSLSLVFTLIAIDALLDGAAQVAALTIAAVAVAWGGSRRQRATLSLHGAIYALVAASASGLVGGALRALSPPGSVTATWISWPALAALGAATIVCTLPVAQHGRTWGRLRELPRLLVLVVVTLGGAGLAVVGFAELFLAGAGESVTAPWLTALRTGALALAAVALAALGRYERVAIAAWLVYPLLVLCGLKLVVEDLRVGRPLTLVLSLVLFGGALILAPRLVRRRFREPSARPTS